MWRREAKNPQVARDIAAFQTGVANAKDIQTALANPNVMKVLLTANNLSRYIAYPALAQKGLLSDPSQSGSLVNRLNDTTLLNTAKSFDFAKNGLAALQDPQVVSTLTNGYAEVLWRQSLEKATPGLANALAFLGQASSITSVDEILGDSVNRSVVLTALGIPEQVAFQNLTAQEQAVSSRLDVKKLQDPKFVTSLTDQYLLAMQQKAQSSSQQQHDGPEQPGGAGRRTGGVAAGRGSPHPAVRTRQSIPGGLRRPRHDLPGRAPPGRRRRPVRRWHAAMLQPAAETGAAAMSIGSINGNANWWQWREQAAPANPSPATTTASAEGSAGSTAASSGMSSFFQALSADLQKMLNQGGSGADAASSGSADTQGNATQASGGTHRHNHHHGGSDGSMQAETNHLVGGSIRSCKAVRSARARSASRPARSPPLSRRRCDPTAVRRLIPGRHRSWREGLAGCDPSRRRGWRLGL